MPPPPHLSRSAIDSRHDRTRTSSSTFDPLAAQTASARIRRPPRNRSLTTPSRLLWEQQLQNVVSEASATTPSSITQNTSSAFSWDPSLAVSQAPSIDGQSISQPSWPLPEDSQRPSGDIPAFSVETASSVYEGSDPSTRNLGFDEQLHTEDMSSLGFVIPQQQYTGLETYGSNFEQSSYNMQPHPYGRSPAASHAQSPPSNYRPSYGLSPALLGSASSQGGAPNERGSDRVSPRMESPAYRSTPMGAASIYSIPQNSAPGPQRGLSYPTVSGDVASTAAPTRSAGLPTQYLPEQGVSSYDSHYARSPPQYGSSYGQGQQQPQPGSMPYLPSLSQSFQPSYVAQGVADTPATGPTSSQGPVRVINSRPKPQCWEHGCNGRQFSTFSNLLRHQREKSGTAAKSYCPKCGAEFTRTTARNGHLAHEKCSKQRKSSEGAP
ncbi:MAG: hypothetical protein M1822_004646 [Bathelium mastoideum]|nr:MAG: hypothetical protein M1822_004646 [Bathelium mastoideum]